MNRAAQPTGPAASAARARGSQHFAAHSAQPPAPPAQPSSRNPAQQNTTSGRTRGGTTRLPPHTYKMYVTAMSLFLFSSHQLSIVVLVFSLRLQHENCSVLNEESIQGNYFPLHGLNLSNRPGAPNATRRHRPPDLPPQSIPGRSERVTLSLSSSSLIFVLKVS
jgi:hypothetical protein